MAGSTPQETLDPPRPRRDEILERAAELFATKGIAATTVREIGDAVGMLSGSLYHHFASKEEMIDAIISSYLEELQHQYEAVLRDHVEPRDRLAALIRASLHSVQARPHAVQIYQTDFSYLTTLPRFAYLIETADASQAIWIDTIRSGIADGVFRADLDAEVAYRLVRDAIWMSVRWFRENGRMTVDELADECLGIFLHGILERDGG